MTTTMGAAPAPATKGLVLHSTARYYDLLSLAADLRSGAQVPRAIGRACMPACAPCLTPSPRRDQDDAVGAAHTVKTRLGRTLEHDDTPDVARTEPVETASRVYAGRDAIDDVEWLRVSEKGADAPYADEESPSSVRITRSPATRPSSSSSIWATGRWFNCSAVSEETPLVCFRTCRS